MIRLAQPRTWICAVIAAALAGSGASAQSPVPQSAAAPAQSSSGSSSSAPPQLRYWSSSDPNAQVTVIENTVLHVRTNQAMSTRQTREGTRISFTLSDDVVVDGVLIIPRGASLKGTVVSSRQPGTLTGSAEMILELTSLEFGGHTYPVYTYQFKVMGASKTRPTQTKVKTGAAIGAVAGLIFSGSANGQATAVGKLAGMGTGAALGAGVGTAVAAATPGPVIGIPAESQLDFSLASPLSVVPPTEKEAKLLAQGLHAGGPVLYVRGETP